MNKYLKFLTLSAVIVFSSQSFVNAAAADIDQKEKGLNKSMKVVLPTIIQTYVDASNQHNVKSTIACFSESAVVYDEKRELKGKKAIEEWVAETIEKYNFQFKPVSFKESGLEKIVTMEVSGTFPGSPITLRYHFLSEHEKLISLKIG